MIRINVIFVLSAIFTYCNSAYIANNAKKCSFSDDDCLKDLYGSFLMNALEAGIPDLGIPGVDPFTLKDREITAMGMLKFVLVEGIAKGFKSCRANRFHTETSSLITSIELVCDTFVIEGKYKIESTPTLEALIGGIKIHGEGNGGATVESLKLNLEVPFEIKKLEDCELHVVIIPDQITSTLEVLGKASIHADSFYIGKQEISNTVVNVVNENWEFAAKTAGKTIADKAIEVFMEYANKFFSAVPITDLISDHLSSKVTQ